MARSGALKSRKEEIQVYSTFPVTPFLVLVFLFFFLVEHLPSGKDKDIRIIRTVLSERDKL